MDARSKAGHYCDMPKTLSKPWRGKMMRGRLSIAVFKTNPSQPKSGNDTLNRNHIHPLIVKHCTNVSAQRRIASVLKSFDDKIENNNRINHNLSHKIFKCAISNIYSNILV